MQSLHPIQLAVEERFLKMKEAHILRQNHHPLDKIEARAAVFSEMQSYWSIPVKETAIVVGLAVSKGKYPLFLNLKDNKVEVLQCSRGPEIMEMGPGINFL